MSITKVAELAGVSNTTVSFVINNKPGISQDTVSKVKSAMKEIGYVPRSGKSKNSFREELVGLRTGNIGVAMGENVISTSPFYSRLFESLHHTLDDRGLKMVPLRINSDSSTGPNFVSDLDAVILCFYYKNLADKFSLPIVSVLGHPEVGEKLIADHIEPANDRIGVIAARYFIDGGHKNILAVNPAVELHPAFETRLQFFVNAAENGGITANLKNVPYLERDKESRLIDGDDVESIKEFIVEYKSMSDRPTGIFVPCDSHLAVLQKSFSSAGIRPGVDVEFLGCNNETILLDGMDARPATIDINPGAIAKAAVNVLLQRVSESEVEDEDKAFQLISIEPSLVSAGSKVKERW